MGKIALTTPLYVSGAWTLMISYQLFTETAVTTVLRYLYVILPSIGGWLVSRLDMIVFVYAFAWVFIISSVIPAIILGKNRGVLIQFSVSLVLTFVSIMIQDGLITLFNTETIDQIFKLTSIFTDPLIAAIYLTVPYIIMIIIDNKSRKLGDKNILVTPYIPQQA